MAAGVAIKNATAMTIQNLMTDRRMETATTTVITVTTLGTLDRDS